MIGTGGMVGMSGWVAGWLGGHCASAAEDAARLDPHALRDGLRLLHDRLRLAGQRALVGAHLHREKGSAALDERVGGGGGSGS